MFRRVGVVPVVVLAPLLFQAPSGPGRCMCRWAAARPRIATCEPSARVRVDLEARHGLPPTGTAARLYRPPPAGVSNGQAQPPPRAFLAWPSDPLALHKRPQCADHRLAPLYAVQSSPCTKLIGTDHSGDRRVYRTCNEGVQGAILARAGTYGSCGRVHQPLGLSSGWTPQALARPSRVLPSASTVRARMELLRYG